MMLTRLKNVNRRFPFKSDTFLSCNLWLITYSNSILFRWKHPLILFSSVDHELEIDTIHPSFKSFSLLLMM